MTSVYDQLNGAGRDYDYWRGLARSVRPRDLCDLGCGTGMLTVLLAADGYRVTGVDPDPAMLAVARSRPGHDTVTWVEGHAEDVTTGSADLLTMTGHVSQVFLDEREWHAVLARIAGILRPGGVLAFDMRNPLARGWEAWNPRDSRRSVVTAGGPAAVWHEVTEVAGTLVSFRTTTEMLGSGDRRVVTDTLRFRDEPTLRKSLARAGFEVTHVHGDWDGSPASPSSRELLVTARRLPSHRFVDERDQVEVADAGRVVTGGQRTAHEQGRDPPQAPEPVPQLLDDGRQGVHTARLVPAVSLEGGKRPATTPGGTSMRPATSTAPPVEPEPVAPNPDTPNPVEPDLPPDPFTEPDPAREPMPEPEPSGPGGPSEPGRPAPPL